MSNSVIIGSRGSDLALWQAHFFQDELTKIGISSEIKIITTKGDRIQHLSFDKIEGKGFFTKEIEAALLEGEIDVAIHSHKDLETKMPPGLTIAGVSSRANPSDMLLIHPKAVDKSLPLSFRRNAVVGTSSARRKSQIRALRSDISIKDIRGNVPTRINKLRSGDFDAILLAAAGIERLDLDISDLLSIELDPRIFIPAPAQGVLAYQCREQDSKMQKVIQSLHNKPAANAIAIERGILSGFGGGCHIPIGVNAIENQGGFTVRASFGEDWNRIPKRVRFGAHNLEEALVKFESLKKQALPASVFISRLVSNDSHLLHACHEHQIKLIHTPCIEICPKEFALPSKYDWLFFASSNAVEVFFAQVAADDIKGKKLAVYGSSTARSLYKYVKHIDFIPDPGQPSDVAQAVMTKVSNGHVLFPTSDVSLNTISSALNQDQVTSISIYQTKELDTVKVDPCEAYVFTSPSNVRGFLMGSNVINKDAKVIAIGNSTAKELESNGLDCQVASVPHEAELFALVCS
ncbi:MAG: hypothetical protein Salg2KO_04730 [Salibacteraceae bacterium]